jgi:hypothetical protein
MVSGVYFIMNSSCGAKISEAKQIKFPRFEKKCLVCGKEFQVKYKERDRKFGYMGRMQRPIKR